MSLIKICNVSHAFESDDGPIKVLKNLDLSVERDSLTAVVGPSGCGKSTLTRLISGLLKPDRGEIFLEGEKVVSPRSNVGMAFQNPVLLEWRTILDNIMLPLEIVAPKMPKKEKVGRAERLLSLVGLADFAGRRPSELSGGMRQRASLCRAIVHKPKVLIMDEPFGALDAFTREDLWQVLLDVKAEEPFTGLLITHDLRESIFLADQVAVLSGRPAMTQYLMDVEFSEKRNIELLFTAKSTAMLKELRKQIRIAQAS